MSRFLCAVAVVWAAGCAQGKTGDGPDDSGTGPDGGSGKDASSCGSACDSDGDGVSDGADQCPGTPGGAVVNQEGCADSQVSPTLQPTFPPYGLTWTPTGDVGRAGGLQWTYTGIQRGDLFHIYWVICDDPATPCGLSLDGPIDAPAEGWHFDAANSNLPGGRLAFIDSTHITLYDGTTPAIAGRMTVTIVDASNAPVPFATLTTLGVTGRTGQYGAELPGTGFQVTILIEVQDSVTLAWTPYLDYYDASPTADPGVATVSFGGSFYDE